MPALAGPKSTVADAPAGQLPYTDGALNNESQFDAAFPYLKAPLPGRTIA